MLRLAWAAIPLPAKLIGGGVVLLAILYAFNAWLDNHDSRIKKETRDRVQIELTELKKAEWAKKEEAIAKDREAAILDRKAATLDRQAAESYRKEAIALRQADHDIYVRNLAAIQARWEADSEQTRNIPESQLNDVIRGLLAELAAGIPAVGIGKTSDH